MIYISRSISNFRDKLLERHKHEKISGSLFYGLYTYGDYWRFLAAKTPRTVFWCGSDIKNLQRRPWMWWLKLIPAMHLCENWVEYTALENIGIGSIISPAIFDPTPIPIAFNPDKQRAVYINIHKGREEEYGLPMFLAAAQEVPTVQFHVYGIYREDWGYAAAKNVTFHGKVSNVAFNRDIQNYHAAVRLNTFDGFAETVAKSILMGQYPITRIYYPEITCVSTLDALVEAIKELELKDVPNPAREFWKQQLCAL